jgi:hypothetical protein
MDLQGLAVRVMWVPIRYTQQRHRRQETAAQCIMFRVMAATARWLKLITNVIRGD